MKRRRSFESLERRFARALIAIACLTGANACTENTPIVPDDIGQFRAITRAAFVDSTLWLLEDNGTLVSLSPKQGTVAPANAGGKVLDICKSRSRLTVLVEISGKWTLKKVLNGSWTELGSTSSGNERLIAMDCNADQTGATLLTENRLIEMTGGEVRSTDLSDNLARAHVTATTVVSGDSIWLGLNSGEWGGGLRRISRTDGRVETIALNRSGELCGGPLNTDCDPVNGLAVSPWNPNCVIAAVGLIHIMMHGRIVEVCGETVRRLYFKPSVSLLPYNPFDDREPASTIAFFGLAGLSGRVVAIGSDGIYYFDGAAAPHFQPLPEFQNIEGYRVSFGMPDVVLVPTDVNARASLSGSAPIIALR